MKILLIEDDKELGQSLKNYFELNNIETVWLWDERNINNLLKVYDFDVIVLDLILSFSRGEDIISLIRSQGIKTLILVLTAKNSLKDKEVCFQRGADDYLTKPFEPKELILRIKALSKRKRIDSIITIGDLTINTDAKTIKKGDEEIKISKTAWDLLILLIKKRRDIVDTETILNYVWSGKAVGDEIVRTYIKELRKILPPDSIQTYKGRGYRLI